MGASANRYSNPASFSKVPDGRKPPIRGLWVRNGGNTRSLRLRIRLQALKKRGPPGAHIVSELNGAACKHVLGRNVQPHERHRSDCAERGSISSPSPNIEPGFGIC